MFFCGHDQALAVGTVVLSSGNERDGSSSAWAGSTNLCLFASSNGRRDQSAAPHICLVTCEGSGRAGQDLLY